MNLARLVTQSLRHYWRMHLAVCAGVFLTSSILGGALVVGDSVRESLRRRADARLSGVSSAVVGGDRFFTQQLGERVGAELGATVSGIILWSGSVSVPDDSARANAVQVLGVDESFWQLGESGSAPVESGRYVAVNEALARRLGVGEGDAILLRAEVPGAISRDAALSGSTDAMVRRRLKIDRVVGEESMGSFSLRNEQAAALNLYLPREVLQGLLERDEQVNVLLAGAAPGAGESGNGLELQEALAKHWTLADASLGMREIAGGEKWEVSSGRIFIDRPVAAAIREIAQPSDGVLTYLVNGIRHGDREAPYSMVAAVETNISPVLPDDLGTEDIVITGWLAEDLGIKAGDEVDVRFFVAMSGRQLEERSKRFTVAGVLPMTNPYITDDWTPRFPGISEADNCRDWKPGIPIDTDAIRPVDEDYWDTYKGTPKGFITLAAGRELWSNRFGDITALHFMSGSLDEATLESRLKEKIDPADFGLAVRDLAGEAASSVANSYDFGGLFAGMSFFLIVAALVLTALLFAFGVEQRADQLGLCLALGMQRKALRRWFLLEALAVSVAGALAGAAGSVIYTRFALWGLGSMWSEAVSGMTFVYSARPASLVIAVVATVALAMMVVFIVSRNTMRIQPRELITGGHSVAPVDGRPLTRTLSFWLGLIMLLGGAALLFVPAPSSEAKQGLFLGGAFMLLVAGICACALLLRAMARRGGKWTGSLWSLGRTFALTRRGRSLAVAAMMAAGVFMVTALNAMRLNADVDAAERSSGTGGFQYVGESTLPVYEDFNAASGRETIGLDAESDFAVVAMRMSEGDDASCLNLNRAQNPRLLGVDAALLAKREAFPFGDLAAEVPDGASPWSLLAEERSDGLVPGIVDMNTALYALGIKAGDTLEYEDGKGEAFGVKVVALLANTMLQGSVIIAEDQFVAKYPDTGGYRFFLVDAPEDEAADAAAKTMNHMLEDRGFALSRSPARLAEYNAVRNAYLSIFSMLGGLGVLLGTVGLAILVARNVLERRGQLGLMRAVGLRKEDLARLVLAEHWFLHVLGVVVGLGAAVVAVSGKLTEAGGDLPLGLLLVLVAGILVAGLFFCWLAARWVVRFPLLESLRSE